jgi:hypothetical protein
MLFIAVPGLVLTARLLAAEPALPTTWDGHSDFNGIWQAIGTAHWDIQDHPASAGPPGFGTFGATPPGPGIVVDNEIPYLPDALEQKNRNYANRFTEDPEIRCFMPGVPRATYLPYPFQIVQGNDKILIAYSFAETSRTIHMNMENPEPAPIDSWMGRSHGHWEGNTLVVEAAGFNGRSWLDRAGNFASASLVVTERYSYIKPDVMLYEATLEDPAVFSRPWTLRLPLYRRMESGLQLPEFKCVEYAEEILYGHLRANADNAE